MHYIFLLLLAFVYAAAAEPARAGWWRGQAVTFQVIDGLAVAEGDILLGPAAEIPEAPDSGKSQGRAAVAQNATRYVWPDRTIPYVIDAALANPSRVTAAIEHWSNNTPIRLIPRTNEPNYVRFARVTSGGCSSFVGMIGREQAINLSDECSEAAVIHEIGHAVGLFHEQSRGDRDFFIQLLPENADKRELSNYAQPLSSGRDIGPYDFASIMHYGVTGFSRNGRPVLQTLPAGIPLGQRDGLSPLDIAAVRELYGVPTDEVVIGSAPPGLELEVDGARVKTPFAVRWAPGSQHTLGAPGPQVSGSYRYVFGRWSDEAGQTHTVIHSADTAVYSAAFVRQYRMALGVNSASAGRLQITPAPEDGYLTEGTEVELRPVPNPGFRFGGWSGFGPFGLHGGSPDPLRVVVNGPEQRYTANFTTGPVTLITSEPAGLKLKVDGTVITTPQGFGWQAGSSHTIEVAEETQETANRTARHRWTGWSNGGDQRQTIIAGTASQTYTAQFRTQFLVTRLSSSGGTVRIIPSSPDDYYDAGTVLSLEAIGSAGRQFFSWTGDARGDAQSTLTVDDQKVAGAVFAFPRQIVAGGVVNAASYNSGFGLAPGSIVSVFGPEIGPPVLEGMRLSGDRADTTLAGYRVLFDNVPAPLVFAARNQIAAVVPWAVASRAETAVRVSGPGWTSDPRAFPVVPTNPGLFTAAASGTGPAAVLNEDRSVNGPNNPARAGSVVVLFGTGGGLQDGSSPDGAVSAVAASVRATVRVRVAGRDARVLYAGAAPGLIGGALQVNVEVPHDCPSGAAPVSLFFDRAASAGGPTIFIRN